MSGYRNTARTGGRRWLAGAARKFLALAEEALRAAGDSVLMALSGTQAIELMATVGGQVKLLMVDLDLPKVSGFSVIEQVRGAFPDIPVIAFSGVMRSDMLEVAKYLGASQALRKPIDREWLNAIAATRSKAEEA